MTSVVPSLRSAVICVDKSQCSSASPSELYNRLASRRYDLIGNFTSGFLSLENALKSSLAYAHTGENPASMAGFHGFPIVTMVIFHFPVKSG